MTLSDLREKTRRGQQGRARAGRIPRGLAEGDEVVTPAPGSREAGRVSDRAQQGRDQSARLRFVCGRRVATASRIRLNAEKVPGPGSRPRGETTIRGKVERGIGIPSNTLDVGQRSWNRCSYVKDPQTGRRAAPVDDASQLEVVDVPELRVIDQAACPTWSSARSGVGVREAEQRRRLDWRAAFDFPSERPADLRRLRRPHTVVSRDRPAARSG